MLVKYGGSRLAVVATAPTSLRRFESRKFHFPLVTQTIKDWANTQSFIVCAPGGTRTPNDGSEDRNDIHFTTGANVSTFNRINVFVNHTVYSLHSNRCTTIV